ncbi:MAG: DNA mismatch repair endonuclease MutL [Prevotellaceae bacterium]|jgi:DNA mismatch repair protein MutL|nr:DNA mismatch repair endonuclease MutL [Prevotellaceae bacterium]
MQNIIQLLPDSVANQIAAGEVVQRPASVVKELVENAIDAGATSVSIVIKDAGRTLVQVVDNGCGMSEVDVRLAFERHATSKIREAIDLFNLHSFGFRGEALASIVSVAEVEVKTRTPTDDVGTRLVVNGSEVQRQEPTSCPAGTSIAVKNLFYNIPARRKFLKSDNTEFRHIESELKRLVLCHPEVAFALWRDGNRELELPAAATLKQRIVATFAGIKYAKNLIDVAAKTQIVNLHGFVATPESATRGEQDKQFLFVNGRYFQSGYFRSAVLRAYEQLLPQGVHPSYFIYFEVDPASIDVNIHPTKTEIKFEDEKVIWQILYAAVRESIGKYALAPTLNFETSGTINIPMLRRDTVVSVPQIAVDPTYNPFREPGKRAQSPQEWQKMYDGMAKDHPFFREGNGEENGGESEENGKNLIIESQLNADVAEKPEAETTALQGKIFQLKAKYILTPVKSGLMVVDQARAHRRVLYEELLQSIEGESPAQKELFPQAVRLSSADYDLLLSVAEDLLRMGLEVCAFGDSTVVVQAMPAIAHEKAPGELLEELLATLKREEKSLRENHRHALAASMAASMAIRAGKTLSEEEMHNLIARLLSCASPDICPDGKPTMAIVGVEELDRKFQKRERSAPES